MIESTITFRVPRWRARLALAAAWLLAVTGKLTNARMHRLSDWVARGVKVGV